MFKIKKELSKTQENILAVAIGIFIAIIALYFFRIVNIHGDSMCNTYENNDKVFTITKPLSIKYKDIIIADMNDTLGKNVIKRVIGVEGDKIVIKDNKLYINDNLVEEPYINEPMLTADTEFIVPKDSLYVLGDNRNHSLDSRTFGFIHKDNIIGKVLFKLPF